jgi:hypothetical protein
VASTYVISSPRAGIGSTVVQETARGTYVANDFIIYETSIIPAPGAAQMDGVASVSFAGHTVVARAAQMDGHADVFATGAFLAPGAANMNGVASVTVNSLTLLGGYARMDGRAQVQAASTTFASGAANMDGRASEVVAQSVLGAGLAEFGGAASMIAVAPHRFNVAMLENIIGSGTTLLRTGYRATMLQGIVGGELLKPLAHYRWTFHDTINSAGSISYHMKFIRTLRDVVITLTPSLKPHSQFHYVFTSPISVRPTLASEWFAVLSLVQNLLVGQTMSPKFIWGRVLTQAIKISVALGSRGQHEVILAQLLELAEVEGFKLRHPVTLSQNIDLSSLPVGGISLKLLQKLLVAATVAPAFSYHFTLAGRIIADDILEHLVGEILAELFTVHDTLGRQFVSNSLLAQLLTVQPALTNTLVLKIVGDIQLSPEQLVSMLYRGDELLDGVTITALYISPSGTTTTWAVNTRTNAVTEYMNYDFRSFTKMGDRYIAAGSDGLYELDGDTDDGKLIISELMSGYLQLNEKKLFGIKGAYVAIRGGGRFYLKLIAGDGRTYVYELKSQPNLMTTKVKVGKGISTTYMAFDLVTEGQDFDLDSLEFIPMTRGRRV